MEKHSCEVCLAYSKDTKDLNENNIYTHFRTFNTEKNIFGNLCMPNQNFCEYFNQLENIFVNIFPDSAIQNVGLKIKERCLNIPFYHPCKDFPSEYFISLFVRVRIYYSIKFINRDFKIQKQNKENYKLKNLKHL